MQEKLLLKIQFIVIRNYNLRENDSYIEIKYKTREN